MGTRIIIDGLPPGFSETDLRLLVARHGSVLQGTIARDPLDRSLGFASVDMAEAHEAEVAFTASNDRELQGRRLLVTLQDN